MATFDITCFGAVKDGAALCTDAIAEAIRAAEGMGGGTVHIPAGCYFTGPICLKSHITLHVEAGAVVRFINDKELYPQIMTRYEGTEQRTFCPLIYGKGLTNIAITGRGTLDGQGAYWWEQRYDLPCPRPRFVGLDNCSDIIIEGVTLINSPAWTISPVLCRNININHVTIKNPWNSPNTDGINPDACRNVHISNCTIDVGDDCITIKSGTEDCVEKAPCENITITNCTMIHGHGGVVIGSEMSGDVRNVTITNCVMNDTDRGIRMKTRRGRGGVIENILISNVVMNNVLCPFVMCLFYWGGAKGKSFYVWDKNPHPVDSFTPLIKGVHFSNIIARQVRSCAGFIYGLPEMPVRDISFSNVSVSMADGAEPQLPAMMKGIEPMAGKGFFLRNTSEIFFQNTRITNVQGESFDYDGTSVVAFG